MLRPYRSALSAALGSALLAGLIVALIDATLTAGSAEVSVAALLPVVIGLYIPVAIVAGLVAGAVAGATTATFGPGALGRLAGRLRDDRALDHEIAAGIVAGAVVLALVAGVTAFASLFLVAGVERKGTGVLLAGAVVAAALPFIASLGLPVYRAARGPVRVVPRLGPLPASAVLAIVGVVVGGLAAAAVVTSKLDWRAIPNLGGYGFFALFGLLFGLNAYLAHGPLGPVRERIPAGGIVVAVVTVGALAMSAVTLKRTPEQALVTALGEHSKGARMLMVAGRSVLDRDGDGESAFLGGPDCDDSNPNVYSTAKEIPGNGIDENCLEGDRRAVDVKSVAGNGAKTAAPPVEKRAESVVIIAIDTLRADRLGVAGYKRDGKSLTPVLDKLAGQGAYFTHVWAQAPNTPRSFPSILASKFPSQIKVDKDFQNYPDPLDENLFLFEILKSAGLSTHGIASHFYFDRAPGIRQGFDSFDNEGAQDIAGSNKDIAAPRIVPKVEAKLAELAGSKERFALFVHLFEPHSTYLAHDQFPITESGVPALVQKYDYEIAFVDLWIGKILESIEKNGLGDKVMVVVLSDHGEAFGVHRVAGQKMFFHGQTLYDELLRVPLILRVPGLKPAVVDDPVSLVDVGPTVLDGLGVAIPDGLAGRTVLRRALGGAALEGRPIFAQLMPAPSWKHKWMAMVGADGKYKMIYRMSDRVFELYDLSKDKDEGKNLNDSEAEVAAALREELTRWIEVDLAQ